MNTTPFHPNPVLLVWERETLHTCRLDQKQSWLLGGRDADIGISVFPSGSRCGAFRQVEGEWFYIDDPANPGVTFLNGRKLPRPLRGIRQPVPLNSGTALRVAVREEDAAVMLFLCGLSTGEWDCEPLSRTEATRIGGTSIIYLNGQFRLIGEDGALTLRYNRGWLPEGAVLCDGDSLESEGMTMYYAGGVLFQPRK